MSWISTLSWRDLQRLRRAVREIHFRYVPLPFDNADADRLIEALGPETAEKLLRKAVEEKLDA